MSVCQKNFGISVDDILPEKKAEEGSKHLGWILHSESSEENISDKGG